jgi:hypothetical protein
MRCFTGQDVGLKSKRLFRTEHRARVAAERMQRRHRQPFVAYYCTLHSGWHVGHPEGWAHAERIRKELASAEGAV